MENQSLNYELPNDSQDVIIPKDHGDTSDKNKFEESTENDETVNLTSPNENDNVRHMEGSELNENDNIKHVEGFELYEQAELDNTRLIKENRKLSAMLLTERKKRSILERRFISTITNEALKFNAEDKKESVDLNTETKKESVDLNVGDKKESVDLNVGDKKESVDLNVGDKKESVDLNVGDKKENVDSNVEDNKQMTDLNAGDNVQSQSGDAPCDENKLVSSNKKENEETHDAFIYVTTFQLKQMESDMVSLKKLIAKREKTWGFNMEREKQFNNTIRALRIEIQILKSLFDEKQEELDSATKELNDKKNELEKELRDKKTLKKIIIKLEKRHRELLSYMHISDFDIPSGNITEREQKIIRQIVTKYLANRFENKNKTDDNRDLHKSHSQTEFTTSIYSLDNSSRITYEENNQYSQYKFSNSCPSTPKPLSTSELSKESSGLSNDNDDVSNSLTQDDSDIIRHIDYIKNEVLKESDSWEKERFTFSSPDPGNGYDVNEASSSSLSMNQNDKTIEWDNNVMSGLDISNYATHNDTSEDDIMKDEDNEKTSYYSHLVNGSDVEPDL